MGCVEGCPYRKGSEQGVVPLPVDFLVQSGPFLVKNFFVFRQSGASPSAPPPKYATSHLVRSSGQAWTRRSKFCFVGRHAMGTPYPYNPQPISLIIVYTAVQPLQNTGSELLHVTKWLLCHSDFSKFYFDGEVTTHSPDLLVDWEGDIIHLPISLHLDAFSVTLMHAHTS